jgi:hypothetical protein
MCVWLKVYVTQAWKKMEKAGKEHSGLNRDTLLCLLFFAVYFLLLMLREAKVCAMYARVIKQTISHTHTILLLALHFLPAPAPHSEHSPHTSLTPHPFEPLKSALMIDFARAIQLTRRRGSVREEGVEWIKDIRMNTNFEFEFW